MGTKCENYLENLEEDSQENCGKDEEGDEGELKVVGVEVDHEAGPDGGVDGLVVGREVWGVRDHLDKMDHFGVKALTPLDSADRFVQNGAHVLAARICH